MKTKNVVSVLIILFISILLVGCTKEEKFLLEDKYYTSKEYIKMEKEDLNDLIEKKESFAVFVYQPLCVTSYEFNKILTEFSSIYNVSLYQIAFSEIKDTDLNNYVKHYPSFVIYKEGEVVDFLDASSDGDTENYKSLESFTNWFSNYVLIKKTNNINETEIEEEMPVKIDTKLSNVKYDKNKINIYFFWGNGCPHCEKELKFFESIETEYGDYFNLHTFEVWYNKENENLLRNFASKMNDEVKGVPYTIIGKETIEGFSSNHEKRILEAIKSQYKDSYDVYFDKK